MSKVIFLAVGSYVNLRGIPVEFYCFCYREALDLAPYMFDRQDMHCSGAALQKLDDTASTSSFSPERISLIFSSMESAQRCFYVDLVNFSVQEMIGSPFRETLK